MCNMYISLFNIYVKYLDVQGFSTVPKLFLKIEKKMKYIND